MTDPNIPANNPVFILPVNTVTAGSAGTTYTWNGITGTWTCANIPGAAVPSGTYRWIAGGGGGGSAVDPNVDPNVITSIPIEITLDLPAEKKPSTDGAVCKSCDEFNEFAQPNQDDDTFLCYKCRHNL
jgi:hypothetical protein